MNKAVIIKISTQLIRFLLVILLAINLINNSLAQPFTENVNKIFDVKQEDVSAKEVEQAINSLIRLLENKQQQQRLLTELKQLQQANSQLTKQSNNIDIKLDNWIEHLSPRVYKAIGFWQKRFESAALYLYQKDNILSVPLLFYLLIIIVPLLVFKKALYKVTLLIINKYSFDKDSHSLKLFTSEYLKRVSSYLIRLVIPVLIIWLLLHFSANLLANDVTDVGFAWYLILQLLAAVVFTFLIIFFGPILVYRKKRSISRNVFINAVLSIFVISWLFSLGRILEHPQLEKLYGADTCYILRALVNVSLLTFLIWLVFALRPALTFLINFRNYQERQQKKRHSVVRHVLAAGWFVPILFLIVIVLISMLLGDDDWVVFNRSVLTSVITFVGITMHVILGHIIDIKKDYQILTVHQATVNRLHRFLLITLRIILWIITVEILIQVCGYSVGNIEQSLGIALRRPILSIVTIFCSTWLLIIILDDLVQHHIVGGSSARMQTILPLISVVIKIGIILLAVLLLMVLLGLNITPLLAGAGILGLAIGFGAQSLVSDIITGIFILIEDSIAIGDYIVVEEHSGTVEQMSLRTVSLRDLDGVLHVLPFSKIKGVKNLSREFGYTMLRVPVPYDVAVDKVIELIQQSVSSVRISSEVAEHIWSNVEMQGIESFSAGIAIVRARIKTAPFKQWEVSRHIYLDLKRRFEQHNMPWAVPNINFNQFQQANSQENDNLTHSAENLLNPQNPDSGI